MVRARGFSSAKKKSDEVGDAEGCTPQSVNSFPRVVDMGVFTQALALILTRTLR